MKKTKLLSLLVFLLVSSLQSFAQDEKNPWAIGIGTNVVDVANHGIGAGTDQLKDYFGPHDWNILPVTTRLYIARYLGKGFVLDAAGSVNSIKRIPGNNKVSEKTFLSGELGLRYSLSKLFKKEGWFDPYVKLAVGGLLVDKDNAGFIAPALGFNTWFNQTIGLNIESSYKNSDILGDSKLAKAQYVGNQFFQHSLSLVFKFGRKDTDGDGVLDKDDFCPEIPGKLELLGCPDTDGDGIADKDDACPKLAGTLATKGCPDSDKDGVADKNDACPNIPGKIALSGCNDTDGDGVIDSIDKCPNLPGTIKDSGCPDTDGDGIANNKDKCPNAAGDAKNGGCPWSDTDGDGITDNLDKCINDRGPASNNGCPVPLTVEAKKKLGAYAKTIQFNSGKSNFKPGVTKKLDQIVKVMTEFEGVVFDVEGHSDSQGNDESNLILSQSRAEAVVNYLTSHGVKEWRLKAVGYGETRPIATNKTAAGRALNRRVILTAKEVK